MSRPAPRQSGAALLTALLIVTLVASLASAMVWRQYRAVQIETADRARAQAGWILIGALDWARLILREDARANRSDAIDHLGEVWAVPLAEARLSSFLSVDGASSDNSDDGLNAFLSGGIEDAQSRYNLRRLATETELPQLELRTLIRLCANVGVSETVARQLATQLRAAFASSPSESAPIKPQNIDQLRWLGLSSEVIERLRPVVTLLPDVTPVNINTAPREVLAALFDNMDLASAQRLVTVRQTSPFSSLDAAQEQLSSNIVLSSERVGVLSSYFWVTGRLRLEGRVLEERSLVQRQELNVLVLSRQRGNPSQGG
jgi:general secretion pathway protein K